MCKLHTRTPVTVHHTLSRVEVEGDLVPLLKSGKARCLGDAEQLVSWEYLAERALGVPVEPRCWERDGVHLFPRV